MKIVGSIIARLGSKRLTYKNLLPFKGKPMIGLGIETLQQVARVDEIVVSTEDELIARVAHDFGAKILKRPPELADDNIPSIPVFQHILQHFPCDVHVNLNTNFPLCSPSVIERCIDFTLEKGEALSDPFAVWGQTAQTLQNYGNPWAPEDRVFLFPDENAGPCDVHSMEDLLLCYRISQKNFPNLWHQQNP